ncbi:MAG: hypothetical protein ACFFDT_13295 [Candidatus Hodarchaeota archaeon]
MKPKLMIQRSPRALSIFVLGLLTIVLVFQNWTLAVQHQGVWEDRPFGLRVDVPDNEIETQMNITGSMVIENHSRLSPAFLIERLILREGIHLIFTLDPSKADPSIENITQQYYIRLLYKPRSTDSFVVVNEVTHIYHTLYQITTIFKSRTASYPGEGWETKHNVDLHECDDLEPQYWRLELQRKSWLGKPQDSQLQVLIERQLPVNEAEVIPFDLSLNLGGDVTWGYLNFIYKPLFIGVGLSLMLLASIFIIRNRRGSYSRISRSYANKEKKESLEVFLVPFSTLSLEKHDGVTLGKRKPHFLGDNNLIAYWLFSSFNIFLVGFVLMQLTSYFFTQGVTTGDMGNEWSINRVFSDFSLLLLILYTFLLPMVIIAIARELSSEWGQTYFSLPRARSDYLFRRLGFYSIMILGIIGLLIVSGLGGLLIRLLLLRDLPVEVSEVNLLWVLFYGLWGSVVLIELFLILIFLLSYLRTPSRTIGLYFFLLFARFILIETQGFGSADGNPNLFLPLLGLSLGWTLTTAVDNGVISSAQVPGLFSMAILLHLTLSSILIILSLRRLNKLEV